MSRFTTVKSWTQFSNISQYLSRKGSKLKNTFKLVRRTLNTQLDGALFYIVPLRKSLDFREVLTKPEMDKVRERLTKVLERQYEAERSRDIPTFKPKPVSKSKIKDKVPEKSSTSILTAFKFPSYLSLSSISNTYLNGNKQTQPPAKKIPTKVFYRIEESVSKGVIDLRTRELVDAFDRRTSRDTNYLKRMETFCTHLHKHPWALGLAVREKAIGKILVIRDKSINDSVKVQCNEALGLLGYSSPPPSRGIRILTIDGGGMRGLIALEMLKAIEHYTGKRIHENFDLICGVSTGAIIASFLGFHKKSIEEVETTYNTIGFKIFSQSLLEGARGWVMNHSYYNTNLYENILKGYVGDCRMIESQRSLGSVPGSPKVALVSTLVSGDRITPFVFRSYRLPYRTQSNYRGSSDTPIWAAVRASSAAPGYFNDFLLDDMVHQDGGILTNNATQIAIHEAHRIWPNEKLQCVISLGLGRFDGALHPQTKSDNGSSEAKPLSIAKKFARIVDSATDTELVHETLYDLLPGQIYYRFNPYLTEYLSLDETRAEKFQLMRESTNMYLRRNESKVRDACDQLLLTRWPMVRLADFAKIKYEKFSSRYYASRFQI